MVQSLFRVGWVAMRSLVRRMIPVVAVAAAAVLAAAHLGCSRATPPGPTTVRGRVTFQGRPVAGGLVVFAPDPARGAGGKPARGETNPDGLFQLQLDGSLAVTPGWYRVALAAPPSDSTPVHAAAEFPPQLSRPDRSGLAREVAAGKDHFFEFAVEVSDRP